MADLTFRPSGPRGEYAVLLDREQCIGTVHKVERRYNLRRAGVVRGCVVRGWLAREPNGHALARATWTPSMTAATRAVAAQALRLAWEGKPAELERLVGRIK